MTFPSRATPLLLLAVVSLYLPAPTQAQAAQRKTVSGTVTDGGGHPMPALHVLLQKAGTHVTRSYITDSSGQYRFKNLAADTDYVLWARYRGHNSNRRRVSKFDATSKPIVDLKIQAP